MLREIKNADLFSHAPSSGKFLRILGDYAVHAADVAFDKGEVPVGAALADLKNRTVHIAGNSVETEYDGSGHAELNVMRACARARRSRFLTDTVLFVTLEPCAMCAAAIGSFRVPKLYFGAYDPKGGAVEHGVRLFEHPQTLHKPTEIVGGVRECECRAVLKRFFQNLRTGLRA